MSSVPTITFVRPPRAVNGGRVTIHGTGFVVDDLLTIPIGNVEERVAFASPSRVVVSISAECDAGRVPIAIPGVRGLWLLPLKRPLTEQGLHKRPHIATDRRPQRFVIGFKDHPLCASL